MKVERKKPWFDRFLDKHPKFPLWFSVFAVLLSFKKEFVCFEPQYPDYSVRAKMIRENKGCD